jgi:hypothetical protein
MRPLKKFKMCTSEHQTILNRQDIWQPLDLEHLSRNITGSNDSPFESNKVGSVGFLVVL